MYIFCGMGFVAASVPNQRDNDAMKYLTHNKLPGRQFGTKAGVLFGNSSFPIHTNQFN